MPIIDLITPWSHAVASLDARELRHFRERQALTLEMIRRQRAPLLGELPAPVDWKVAVQRAENGELLEAIRATRDRMVEAGFQAPEQIVLAASAAPGGVAEVIPGESSTVVLFLDRNPAERATHASPLQQDSDLTTALTAAIAILTRWNDPALGNPIARLAARGAWDKWAVAREVPLAEWIYAAGIGVHAGATAGATPVSPTDIRPLVGGATHASPLQLNATDLRRLRAAEHELQSHLDADLDSTGAGMLMRWLDDDGPPAMRRCADGFVVPRGAGRYLGWRMLEERVARVGVLEAAVMEAS